MRIISGIAGGRKLLAPEGQHIRPTGDKVRGAVFNSLRSKIDLEGVSVIDCFCGSGALGLEALSRGAGHCTFIDNNRKSLDLAKENAKNLGLNEQADFILMDAAKLKVQQNQKAAAAFLDPPYNKNLVVPALNALHAGGWLQQNAVLVIEAEKDFRDLIPPPFRILDEKSYGETKILFLHYSV